MDSEQRLDGAITLIEAGQYEKARAICTDLQQRVGEDPKIEFLLGAIALKSGDPAAAIQHVHKAVDLDPDNLQYRMVLGSALHDTGHYEAALSHLEEVLKTAPDTIDALFNSALCLKRLDRTDDAVSALQALRSLDPANQSAILELARLLRAQGDSAEASALIEELSERRGDLTFEAMLASWKLPVISQSKSEMQNSRACYEAAVEGLRGRRGTLDEALLLQTTTNFMAVYQGADDRPCQEAIAEYYRANCPGLSYRARHLDRAPETVGAQRSRIRIGFLSTNFYNHTVGKLFRGMIAELDRQVFEVYVFASGGSDEISQFIRENCDQHLELPEDLPRARDIVADAELDILFFADIGMAPLSYFLAFSRLAHVQCVGWGHGVTTGLPSIDYFISGIHLGEADPDEAQSHYTEKLVRLSQPPTYLYPFQQPRPATLPELSIPDGATIYFCPQSLFKIHPEFDELLVDVLRNDPDGVAVFIEGREGWSDILSARWRRLDAGINRRIHFQPRLDQNQFLELVRRADVILDTIYCCGGISSAEALSMGKAIVTWPNTPLLFSRVTAAYYEQVGVTDCIAHSAAEYLDIAHRLGTDKEWRNSIEAALNDNRDRLFRRAEVLEELTEFFHSALGRASRVLV